MTRVSEIIHGWLGWCPNGGALRTSPAVIIVPPVITHSSVPDGGAGGPGRASRGINLAVGSIKILFRNLRLFWFSFLTALAMIFNLATSLYIQYISGTNPFPGTGLVMNSPEILIEKGSLLWFALTFTIGFISSFFTYLILAGLITCVSSILSGKNIPVRDGLSRAWDHRRSLAGWAVVGALAGTASTFITNIWTASIPITFLSSGAMLVFFVLTMFVVPAIVLDDEYILPAIRDSVSVFRKMWREIVACFGLLLLIMVGIYLVVLIPIISIGFSYGGITSAGLAVILTMLMMFVLIFIGSTVVGIATFGIYMYARKGILSPAFKGSKEVNLPE